MAGQTPTALYHELNQRYFSSRLPAFRVVFARFRVDTWLGECLPDRRLIRVQRGLRGAALRQTLLHEMCHIGGTLGHGQRFQAKLAHLARQGERWALAEIAYYRQGHDAWPQRQRQLKATLVALASAQPRPSLAAIRRVAADTLVCRVSELSRKAGWLERAWHRACAEADQARARCARHPRERNV